MSINTAWFKTQLINKKISQRKLAKLLDLDPAAICYLLNGKRKMSVQEAKKIALIFHCDVLDVINQVN